MRSPSCVLLALRNTASLRAIRARMSSVSQGTGCFLLIRLVIKGECLSYNFKIRSFNVSTISSTLSLDSTECHGYEYTSVKNFSTFIFFNCLNVINFSEGLGTFNERTQYIRSW